MKNILNNKTIKIMVLLLYMFFVSASSFVFGSYKQLDVFNVLDNQNSSQNLGGYTKYYLSIGEKISNAFVILFIIAVIIFILYIIYVMSMKFRKRDVEFIDDVGLPDENSKEILFNIMQNDVTFDKNKFCAWVEEIFLKIQKAWSNRNIEEIRQYETPELYEQHLNQIDEFKEEQKINVIEEIEINHVHIVDYECENNKEIITVEVSSRMKDYIIDENTQELLEGEKDIYFRKLYKLKFARKIGTKKENNKVIKCQNCGSLVEGNTTMKCKYCGSVIVQED